MSYYIVVYYITRSLVAGLVELQLQRRCGSGTDAETPSVGHCRWGTVGGISWRRRCMRRLRLPTEFHSVLMLASRHQQARPSHRPTSCKVYQRDGGAVF